MEIIIAFASNYLNHHQIPLSEAMNNIEGVKYYFIQTEAMEQERVNMGWGDDFCPSYLIKYYENVEFAQNVITKCDILIAGGVPLKLLEERRKRKKLTFVYTERIYKRGQWRALSPRGFYYMNLAHRNAKKNNTYLLCASAYTPCDMAIYNLYKNRMFKWGYFPAINKYSIEDTMLKKNGKIKILWCGRFVKWKHPEMIIMLANKLKKAGYVGKVEILMIGIGKLREKYEKKIRQDNLDDILCIEGPYSPAQVRKKMLEANIFVATSDYNEGWGAVINEAMTSGCAVVASHAMGSVPYLIHHKYNGLVFKSGSLSLLYKCIVELVSDSKQRELYGKRAYNTIKNVWNAEVAAKNFVALTNSIVNSDGYCKIKEGPCSKADIIQEWKMYERCVKTD